MWGILWLVMVAAIVSIWAAPRYWERHVYPRIRVEAEALDGLAEVDDAVVFRCRLINPTRLPCPRVQLSWALPEQLRGDAEGREGGGTVSIVTYLMPRQQAEATFTVYAARRGVADWKEAYLVFTDALGLWKHFRTVYVEARTIVRPKRGQPLEVAGRFTELLGDIRTKRYYNEDPSLFTGVRPYIAGDPLRQISWYATARSNTGWSGGGLSGLMVKQFGYTTASKALILFNGQVAEPYWKVMSGDRLDTMCRRFVQVAEKLAENGATVGMLTNLYDGVSLSYYEPPSSASYQMERLANRMGSISRHPMSSFADLIHSAAKVAAMGDTVVVLTSYWDEDGIRALYELHRKLKQVFVYNLYWDDSAPPLYGIPSTVERFLPESAPDDSIPGPVKEAAV
ncbi:DUF58 domain-containing protein [Paenibacillus thermotolerans]|uniref:DUF58 domain-containing protein n=1 Tax=Paenibacillus thermotolerans TaxID=3027807 RepID=UPI0023682CDF|nr:MULTISPECIES: DUF58 domain-containing protein [unclassified Paenibacillus]